MKKTLLAGAAAFALFVVTTAPRAQEPLVNIDPARHGNLAAAQELTRQAFDKLTLAQQDHNYDLGGHVGRAKALLRQANQEIKLAADVVNSR